MKAKNLIKKIKIKRSFFLGLATGFLLAVLVLKLVPLFAIKAQSKEEGGKLFNRFSIIALTPEQETEVKEISQNIYRPCCGNSTYFPDCNHGAAMLGFIELAVKQGLSKDEIYKKALALNTYWFPQTYAELGMYFKQKKNISWDKVNPKLALGIEYSSGGGYRTINKELQSEGLLPKVEGGGGCGV